MCRFPCVRVSVCLCENINLTGNHTVQVSKLVYQIGGKCITTDDIFYTDIRVGPLDDTFNT